MGPTPILSSCVTRSTAVASSSSSSNTSAPTASPKVTFPKMSSPTPSPTLATSPSSTLSANVPHLDSEGINWATFAFRFCRAIMLARYWGYFDGSNTRPAPKDPDNPTNAKKLEQKQWDCDDTIAQCLLSQCLPDEMAMDMEKYPTVKEQWDIISILFMVKSEYVKTDLCQAFLNMCCPKGSDV